MIKTATSPTADVLFAVHAEWAPRPPTRPAAAGTWFLSYTVAGTGHYRQGETDIVVSSGDLALLRRDAPNEHYVAEDDRWEFLGTRFNAWPDWTPPVIFRPAVDGLYRARIRSGPLRRRIQDAFARLLADARRREAARALTLRDRRPTDDRAVRDLLLNTLREIFLLLEQGPQRFSVDPRVSEALQAMAARPHDHHDVATLARVAKLSSSRFSHLFVKTIGVAPMRALRLMRLEQAAARLTHTNDSVTDIARQVGFGSIYDFSRQFRRQYDASPREYRKLRG